MMQILALELVVFLGAAGAEWSPEVFDYNRPARLQVREIPDNERGRIAGTRQKELVFRNVDGQDVPVMITMPPGRGPFPAVILVHGYASSKEQLTRHVGRELVQRGFATVALDLPMHGDRPGPPRALFTKEDPQKTYERLVQAVRDIRQTIDLSENRGELDTSKGVSLLGYSMGGWLATLAGAADRRVSAMVLMVPISEGMPSDAKPPDGERHEQKLLLERFPNLRPTEAIERFRPRPVLIQAGRLDLYLPEEAVDALFAAAREPKELRWYKAGHILPEEAVEEAAEWLVKGGKGEREGKREGKPGR